ncbi:DUF262 domain-containing protein [Halomonas sp. NO4]|uniref:DUF262 domain-containing protein n=1 Tax=Halomonas sp. NO4 TaxID=2484813 RepID=UPI0013D421B2|nr:DUF262 domain-containing protein [Halomonas sp. NO4]
MSSIKGSDLKLHKVLSSDFEFHIPEYQRPYAWEVEQAEELFDDLWTFMEQEDKSEEYFLGSIVLVKDDRTNRADVVDGQQRLTTLTLLLAAIRDRLRAIDEWKGAFDDFVMEPGSRALGLEAKPRLFLRTRDQDFFNRYAQTPGSMGDLVKLDKSRYRDSQLNIIQNGCYYLERLGNLDDEQVGRFGQFIVRNCILVLVSTESFKSAYRIFSVMNDRGLDLEPSDILKANIISGIGERERTQYTELWEDAEVRLSRKGFNDLIAHIRMIFRKEKYRRSVLDEFNDYVVKEVPGSKALMDSVILPYADAFEVIKNRSYVSTDRADNINELFSWLHRVNNMDWAPVAMEFVRRFDGDSETLEKHLVKLERLAASMFIRGVYVTPRVERYGRVLTELEAGKNLLEKGSSLDLTPQAQKETLERLNDNVYDYPALLRMYIMLRMDSFLAATNVSYKHQTTTIEHVLPQNPSDGSQWLNDWSEAQREYWANRLGNLVLLSRQKNSEASNYDFDLKKKKYFQTRNGVSLYACSTQVLNHAKWTEQEVKARHQDLLNVFARNWQLQGLDLFIS